VRPVAPLRLRTPRPELVCVKPKDAFFQQQGLPAWLASAGPFPSIGSTAKTRSIFRTVKVSFRFMRLRTRLPIFVGPDAFRLRFRERWSSRPVFGITL